MDLHVKLLSTVKKWNQVVSLRILYISPIKNPIMAPVLRKGKPAGIFLRDVRCISPNTNSISVDTKALTAGKINIDFDAQLTENEQRQAQSLPDW
jgi:hypothetical protein